MRTHNKNGKWGQRAKAWGAAREKRGKDANAGEKRNKDAGNESSTTSSQNANYKFLGSEATTAGCASASVSATAVTTIPTIAAAVDTLSRSSAPWSAHWPLAALLLGLDDNPGVPPTFSIDPDTTLTTLT
jgi:hypothetical protein